MTRSQPSLRLWRACAALPRPPSTLRVAALLGAFLIAGCEKGGSDKGASDKGGGDRPLGAAGSEPDSRGMAPALVESEAAPLSPIAPKTASAGGMAPDSSHSEAIQSKTIGSEATGPKGIAPDTIATLTGIPMVLIPAGEYLMGDDGGDGDERPAHKVKVSAFYMDAFEVTQKAYESLMQRNPSKSRGPDKPVEQVDWYHAVLYANARSLKEGLKPCYDAKTLACDFEADGYRLPTEAEWEYACRAGSRTRYSFGDDQAKLAAHAWFKSNAGGKTHPVGQKAPNPWGLHDMHGNVAEWCHDVYDERHYQASDGVDPRGPAAGDTRVLRGGSWRTSEESCRSSARTSETPRFADACFGSDAYGFRCVRRPR